MITRRRFLGTILLGCGSAAIPALADQLFPTRAPGPAVELPSTGNLTIEDWQTLRTLVDAIIPETTRSVSASQAGVLNYIDRALAGPYAASLPAYRELVSMLNTGVSSSRLPFRKLEPSEVIRETTRFEREHPDSFSMVRKHTLEGYFSAPRHGGNIGCRGWKVVCLRSHILPWKEIQGQ